MDRILSTIEHWISVGLIFLIPTNLALHVFKAQSHVLGISIDYLIPKLYISDFFVMALFVIWAFRHRNSIVYRLLSLQTYTSPTSVLLYFLIMTLLVSAHQSPHPIAGYWFIIKLIEMTWLAGYFTYHLEIRTLRTPLALTMMFQALVGIVQWIQKQSLLGYYFLGESTLNTASHIAKTGVTGEIRPLPYGTTPHPNVLAGFLAVGLLILLISYHENVILERNDNEAIESKTKNKNQELKTKILQLILRSVMTIPVLFTLLLTQSVSAVIVLIIGLVFLKFSHLHWRNAVAILAIFITTGLAVSPFIEATSVSRRIQLTEISLKMIADEPWLGVGPNNFTARMTDFGRVISTTRFLQPVHNIYLLWISEMGLIATVLVVLLLIDLSKKYSSQFSALSSSKRKSPSVILERNDNEAKESKSDSKKTKHTKNQEPRTKNISYLSPFLAILIIGLADHYPLSLQSGQLLTALTLGIALNSSLKDVRK